MARKRRDYDFTVTAFEVAQEATGLTESQRIKEPAGKYDDKNAHAVILGRLGGLKGGKARARKLTLERRKEIARKAAMARWHSGV